MKKWLYFNFLVILVLVVGILFLLKNKTDVTMPLYGQLEKTLLSLATIAYIRITMGLTKSYMK
ncbi:MAG: hypothetical protein GY810_30925 [Aureispira sp.]|nr:hypothetical protein [Aureispira sp.]